MADRPLSAAQQIYPHLRRAQVSAPEEPRRSVSPLAAAMYPAHVKKEPTPSELKELWRDHVRALAGVRRKR